MNQKIKRILAILALILIAALLLSIVYLSVTGNDHFWGMFGIVILFPIIAWGLLILVRLFK